MGNQSYIKDINRKWLICYLLFHIALFALFSGLIGLSFEDVNKLLSKLKTPTGFLPLVGLPFTIILEGLLSNSIKEVLVFWRFKNRLPGCRAFSDIAPNDHRINMDRVRILFPDGFPTGPREQNQEWYLLYKKYGDRDRVFHSHKTFLLTRDLAALTAILIPSCVVAHLVAGTQGIMILYHGLFLLATLVVIALSSRNYANRFVANVIVEATS